jgi:hypothetical protein
MHKGTRRRRCGRFAIAYFLPRDLDSALRARTDHIVIPAKAGIHSSDARAPEGWVPAFAGMTGKGRTSALPLRALR